MQISIAGPAYEAASQDLNYQRCINWFPVSGGPEARTPIALLPTAGLFRIVNLATKAEVRALMVHSDTVYAVAANKFYKLDFNTDSLIATANELGELSTTNGFVSWAGNSTQLFLVDGSINGYLITIATDTFETISDVDFLGGDTVSFLDSYFIVNRPNSAILHSSASNDGVSWDAVDVVTAESSPDNLVGVNVDKNELWAFGASSVEIYYNAANPTGFPFARRNTAFINYGCGAKGSIVSVDNSLIWLDNRGYVVRAGRDNYRPSVVSNEAISSQIRSYSNISDALAYEHSDRGHLFYVITFPEANRTWAYDLVTTQWHERASFNEDDEWEREQLNCHVRFKSFDLVGDKENGNIYILSNKYLTNDGNTVHRLRTTSFKQFEFEQIGCDSFEIHMQSGQATQTGAGSDPQIMMRYSHDGGYTWSHELTRSIGKVGEYGQRVRWNRLGTGREWIFEFRIADTINTAILDCSVEPDVALQA